MGEMKMVKFSEGDIILREGELNEEMYKIINGHAEIYVDYGTKQESLLKILGPQECFGEFGLLIHKPSIYRSSIFRDFVAQDIGRNV